MHKSLPNALCAARSRRGARGPVVCAATAAALAVLAGCASQGPRITRAELDELEKQPTSAPATPLVSQQLALIEKRPFTLGPGDVLSLTLTGLSAPGAATVVRARVQDDGNVNLPLVGNVGIAGQTLAAAERRIHMAYVPGFIKDLTVFAEIVDPSHTSVVVAGAAANSGLVSLPRNECNVVYAVARANGFGAAASGRIRVLPIDPLGAEAVYDLTSIDDLRRALLAPPLSSGDLVFVEAAGSSAVYVSGLVNAPGPIPVPQHGTMSLVQALSAAGGVRDLLEPKDATLWRQLPSGERVRVQLDLNEILNGNAEDIQLAAGDVVQIPHTLDTRFREWAAANLRIGPFNVGTSYDPLSQYNFNRALDQENNNGGFANTVTDTFRLQLQSLLNRSTVPTAVP